MASLLERLASRGIRMPGTPTPKLAIEGPGKASSSAASQVRAWGTEPALGRHMKTADVLQAALALPASPPRRRGRPPAQAGGAARPVRYDTPHQSPLRTQAGKRKRKQPVARKGAALAELAADQESPFVDAKEAPESLYQSPPRAWPQPQRRKRKGSQEESFAAKEQPAAVAPGKRPRQLTRQLSDTRPMATPQRRTSVQSDRNTASPSRMTLSSSSETCSICCDDVDSSNAVRLRCQHGWYCLQCMSRHVEARLDNGTVQQTCPECNVELAERDLKRMVPPELMDRLLARSLEQAVAATADLRPCPTPNCPMRVAVEPDDSGEFKCTSCKKHSCLRCGVQPYHKRLTCEQYAARKATKRCSLLKWMQKTGTKQCPSCKMGVSKENLQSQANQSKECHKMLCRNCGTRFCFKCLAVLTPEFSCGCTAAKHGFVDPFSGKYVAHKTQLKAKQLKAKQLKATPRLSTTSRSSTEGPGQNGWRRRSGAGGA